MDSQRTRAGDPFVCECSMRTCVQLYIVHPLQELAFVRCYQLPPGPV